MPRENSTFSYWKKDGRIVSYNTSYSFVINANVDDIEAYFSYKPLREIQAYHAPDTNDINSPYVSLSWDFNSLHEWKLMKQFEIGEGSQGISTDGEYIYTSKNTFDTLHQLELRKYTMNGDLVDQFELNNVYASNITSDGYYIYFGNTHIYSEYLYCTDFTHKTIVDSINMNFRAGYCAYDAENDSFWLYESYPIKKIILVNRQGQTICDIPKLSTYSNIDGFGSIIAEDGNLHLLLLDYRNISDYDISEGSFSSHHFASLNFNSYPNGACIGKYDGKDALFVLVNRYSSDLTDLLIYEINCHLAPIKHYRLYRADNQGNTVMLADEFTGMSFIDSTWTNASAGEYRFGISEIYFNDIESDIIWSDPIVKTGIGIPENENDHPTSPSVQKVIEDGKIVIIKDGKRYNVSGQTLN